jgi:hypothetical protein
MIQMAGYNRQDQGIDGGKEALILVIRKEVLLLWLYR